MPFWKRLNRASKPWRSVVLVSVIAWTALATASTTLWAQDSPKTESFVTAALLSDPHLDPFRDPSKAKRLAASPASEWGAILAEAPAADDAAQFVQLQKTCNEKLSDSSAALEMSALQDAAKAHPAVVLVGGDMLVHAFGCRYRTLLDPAGTDTAGLADFAAKTVEYQLAVIQQYFPAARIHFAPGNNDTDCEDYVLDGDSPFLDRLSRSVAAGWRGVSPHDRGAATQDFKRFGSYSLPMAASLPNTRMIALDDLYLSSDYKGTCGKKDNRTSASALLTWVAGQLAEARREHQAVWLLAHIPPEVNIFRTYLHPHDICNGEPAASFLTDDAFAKLLAENRDIVRVFISGHTHIDEIHLIEGEGKKGSAIALKTMPSISPISTNAPAYLLAQIDPATSNLVDYSKRVASTADGAAQWSTAYDFRTAYHEPAFTAAGVTDLLHRWQSAPDASAPEIAAYQASLANGLRLFALRASWPQQLCAMQHSNAAAFAACACSAQGGLLPPVQKAK